MLRSVISVMIPLALIATIACNKIDKEIKLDENLTVNSSGIVRGQSTDVPSFIKKSVVALMDFDRDVFCTGVLIKKDVVLTAKHCVQDRFASSILVAFGAEGKLSRNVIAGVGELKLNENDLDLATFKLDFEVPESFGCEPAELFSSDVRLDIGDSVVITGFGDNPQMDGKLYWGKTKYKNFLTEISYGDGYYFRSILKFGDESSANSCIGDSGAPIFKKHDGRWGVVAINSGTMLGCNELATDMFASDPRANREWIMSEHSVPTEDDADEPTFPLDGIYYVKEHLELYKYFDVIVSGGVNCRKGPGTNYTVTKLYDQNEAIEYWQDRDSDDSNIQKDSKGRIWFITTSECWMTSNSNYIQPIFDF